MTLIKLFSCNLEVQYKSYFLSKAMLFTLFTTFLNIVLPFIIAYRGRGFWLKTESFYEQPSVHFTYDYLLVLETDDPSKPIVCSDAEELASYHSGEEYCSEFEVQEIECKNERKNCMFNFMFNINLPYGKAISSLTIILGLDFQLKVSDFYRLKSVCPLHMQSLAIINREFSLPTSGLKYHGDLRLYQIQHLPCVKNVIETKYNSSLFNYKPPVSQNIIDFIIDSYFSREVITELKTVNSRTLNGHTGALAIDGQIRIPEMEVHYSPSMLQELKWAWPQYLSLVVVFYWLFDRIKRFVFNNRLLMAWEVLPWKK